jgi:protease I
VHVLRGANARDEDFHGAKYAALVLVGGEGGRFEQDPRVVQLAREFLASDKPVAAFGSALNVILEAGGVAGRTLAAHAPLRAVLEGAGAELVNDPVHADGSLITAQGSANLSDFAGRIVGEFSDSLEEHALDEMSDLSFPASDPPAITPASLGKRADRRAD